MAEKQEKITQATKDAERAEANAEHGAPQVPTADESAAAEKNTVSESTREGYEEMLEKGANQQGEGRIP
jgi:hypothetical protein